MNRFLDGLLGVLSIVCATGACIVVSSGRWDVSGALFAAAIYAEMQRGGDRA